MSPAFKSLSLLSFAALLAIALPVGASRPEAGRRSLIVMDNPDDGVAGEEFVSTLEDYVGDLGVTTSLETVADTPPDHDAWVSAAGRIGSSRGAMAVLWFEPDDSVSEAYNIYLVLLESSSGAVIVLPIELGLRRGNQMFRVLAATARMVLDTEILDDLRKVASTSREDPAPDPWPVVPVVSTPEPPPRPPVPREVFVRSFTLHVGYAGDLNPGSSSVVQGGRVGGLFHATEHLALAWDIAYLAGPRRTTLDVTTREQRIPTRFGSALTLDAGKTDVALVLFWSVEMLWAGVETTDRDVSDPTLDDIVRADTGGGLEIRWSVDLWRNLGVFLAVSGQGMAVSHSYRRGDAEAISSSYFRMGWSAGFEIGNL